MSYYKDHAIIYSISINDENKKYIWIANAIDYPSAKETNIKRLEEGNHVSRELQEIYNLKKIESTKNDFIEFEELYNELKDFYPNLMSLASQLSAREYIIKKDLKGCNSNLIILN